MFGQIYFRVLGIGCFLSMALLSSAQSKLDSLHHLNEVVVTARINKEVIPVQSLSGDKLEKLAAHSVAAATSAVYANILVLLPFFCIKKPLPCGNGFFIIVVLIISRGVKEHPVSAG